MTIARPETETEADGHLNSYATTMDRAGPLSIESLLEKQRAEKEAASKVRYSCRTLGSYIANVGLMQPKFLSKEERAKIAIAKRAQEIREQKEKEDAQRQRREDFEKEAEAVRAQEREQERNRDRERDDRYGRGSRC